MELNWEFCDVQKKKIKKKSTTTKSNVTLRLQGLFQRCLASDFALGENRKISTTLSHCKLNTFVMLMTFYVTTETVCTSPSTTINCDDNQLITNHIMNFAASHNLAMVSTLSWETVMLFIMILSSELTHALASAVPMHTVSAQMKQWPDKLTLDGFVWRRSHWPISPPHAPTAVNQSVVGVSPALFLFVFLPLAGV